MFSRRSSQEKLQEQQQQQLRPILIKASRRFSCDLPLKDRHLLHSPKLCSVGFLGEAVLFVYERDSAPAEFCRHFLVEQGRQSDAVRVQCVSSFLGVQPRWVFFCMIPILFFFPRGGWVTKGECGVAGNTTGSGASTWMVSLPRRPSGRFLCTWTRRRKKRRKRKEAIHEKYQSEQQHMATNDSLVPLLAFVSPSGGRGRIS